MNRNRFLIFAAVVGATLQSLSAQAGEIFDYYSASIAQSDVSRVRLDSNDRSLVYSSTYIYYEDCSTSDRFCFESSRLSFCSPTNADLDALKWKCGKRNMTYRIKSELDIFVLGQKMRVYVIGSDGVDYFYSRKRGVVMFRVIGARVIESYWSADFKGFGSVD